MRGSANRGTASNGLCKPQRRQRHHRSKAQRRAAQSYWLCIRGTHSADTITPIVTDSANGARRGAAANAWDGDRLWISRDSGINTEGLSKQRSWRNGLSQHHDTNRDRDKYCKQQQEQCPPLSITLSSANKTKLRE